MIPEDQRTLFLINPRSGGYKGAKIIAALRRYSEIVDTTVQVAELNASYLSHDAFARISAELVVIGGGDGTISLLLPYLSTLNAAIGLLPLGTGNDLARELGIPQAVSSGDIAGIVNFFRRASRQKITYFNFEYGENFSSKTNFINYVSMGFDAKVVAKFAELRTRAWWRFFRGVWGNRLGYAMLSILNSTHLMTSSSFTIQGCKGSYHIPRAKGVLFANIRSIMGIGQSNPHSVTDDDDTECLIIDSVTNYLLMLLRYRIPLFHPRFIGSSDTWEIFDLPDDVYIQIDGEPREDIRSNHYRITPCGHLLMVVGDRHPMRSDKVSSAR